MTDQAAENARAVRALAKTGERGWAELKEALIRCPCSRKGGALARFYTGIDDDGEAALYVWVPRVRAGEVRIPPRAVPVPFVAGATGWTAPTQCEQCGAWWVVFPAGPPAPPDKLEGQYGVTTYRPEGSYRATWTAGEPTVTARFTGEHLPGSGPCQLLRTSEPTWGAVAG